MSGVSDCIKSHRSTLLVSWMIIIVAIGIHYVLYPILNFAVSTEPNRASVYNLLAVGMIANSLMINWLNHGGHQTIIAKLFARQSKIKNFLSTPDITPADAAYMEHPLLFIISASIATIILNSTTFL